MLPQNKISGTNIAWARGKWVDFQDGTSGYIFPEDDAFQIRLNPASMEQLGVSEDDLYDCIAQIEAEYGAPRDHRLAFGLLPKQGYSHLGITVRSQFNDRVVCNFTPTSMEDRAYDGYFEWYYDMYSGGFGNLSDYLARFDKATDSRSSNVMLSPIVPSYMEASEKTSGWMSEGQRQSFLSQVWNYHKTQSRGFKLKIEAEILPQWKKICEEYSEQQASSEYQSNLRTLTMSDLKQVFNDLAAILDDYKDTRPEGAENNAEQKIAQCRYDWVKAELYRRALAGET